MNANAKKWVRALRSGKYKQTQNQLADNEEGAFCCLGVACELAVKAKVISKYNPNGAYLPEKVRKWLGIRQREGRYLDTEHYAYTFLTVDNDVEYKSFEDIAKIIESEPDGLFVKERKKK